MAQRGERVALAFRLDRATSAAAGFAALARRWQVERGAAPIASSTWTVT